MLPEYPNAKISTLRFTQRTVYAETPKHQSTIDLLDIATVSQKNLKKVKFSNITQKREDIKYGLDLLIDGF